MATAACVCAIPKGDGIWEKWSVQGRFGQVGQARYAGRPRCKVK